MKYVLIALFAIVISIEIAFPVRAISMPPSRRDRDDDGQDTRQSSHGIRGYTDGTV
jgi:hypothetical protein